MKLCIQKFRKFFPLFSKAEYSPVNRYKLAATKLQSIQETDWETMFNKAVGHKPLLCGILRKQILVSWSNQYPEVVIEFVRAWQCNVLFSSPMFIFPQVITIYIQGQKKYSSLIWLHNVVILPHHFYSIFVSDPILKYGLNSFNNLNLEFSGMLH